MEGKGTTRKDENVDMGEGEKGIRLVHIR